MIAKLNIYCQGSEDKGFVLSHILKNTSAKLARFSKKMICEVSFEFFFSFKSILTYCGKKLQKGE